MKYVEIERASSPDSWWEDIAPNPASLQGLVPRAHIFADVDPAMRIAQEESSAPSLPVISIRLP